MWFMEKTVLILKMIGFDISAVKAKCRCRRILSLSARGQIVAAMASKFKTVSSELTLEEAFSPENIRSRLKKPEDIFRFEYCTMNEKQFKSIAISPLAWTEGENRQAAAIRSLHKQDGKTIPIVAMTANAFAKTFCLPKMQE